MAEGIRDSNDLPMSKVYRIVENDARLGVKCMFSDALLKNCDAELMWRERL